MYENALLKFFNLSYLGWELKWKHLPSFRYDTSYRKIRHVFPDKRDPSSQRDAFLTTLDV